MSNLKDSDTENANWALELLVKMKVDEIRGNRSDAEMVLYLSRLGCPPSRIAHLLTVPTTTIYPILSKARKKKGAK
jgi:DNA-directed RNA polymerase specialized sigma24 family protein